MKKLWRAAFFSIIQLVAVNLVVYAQAKITEPPLVVLTKGSGEIFLDKEKPVNREYKPKFTEVDISEYAQGLIFAELKLSSGGCGAMLIATGVPTEDRTNNTGYFSLASGEAATGELSGYSIRDGFISYFDRKNSKFNNSSKFYVSADHSSQGMGLWYAKECSGTYEITVYIKYGKKKCGALPPIPSELSRKIAELSKLTSYSERSKIYHQIHEELQRRGIGLGFFEAASVVTDNFSDDKFWTGGFEKKAQDFLDDLSRELAGINANYANELLQTGKLEKEDKSGYFSESRAIDNELVRREQAFAERKLSSLSDSREIIAIINGGTNSWLTENIGGMLFSSAIAANEVRNRKRKKDPKADFDYGNIKDRTAVGEILTAKYWNNYLSNAILCK